MSRGLLMMRCLFAVGALAAIAGCAVDPASGPESVEAQAAPLAGAEVARTQAPSKVWESTALAGPQTSEYAGGMHITAQTVVDDSSAAYEIVPMQFWRRDIACPDHREPVGCACDFSAEGVAWAFHSDGACHCRVWAQGTGTIHTQATCNVAQ